MPKSDMRCENPMSRENTIKSDLGNENAKNAKVPFSATIPNSRHTYMYYIYCPPPTHPESLTHLGNT